MLAYPPQAEPISSEEEGVDVFSILMPLARRWRLITGLTVGLAVLTFIVSFLLTTKYSAHSTFLLDTQDSGNTSGSATNIIFGKQVDPTISLLFSNTLTDAVVQQTNLLARETDPKKRDLIYLRNQVRAEMSASKSPDGLFLVVVADRNPQRAIDIANAYLLALQYLNDKMNFEAAAHTREFYEAQVRSERALLEKAEADLTVAQQRTGLLQPQNQTSLAIGTIAALRGQITGLQVQLASALQGATEENPAVIRLRTEIGALQGKENALQGSIQGGSKSNVPTLNLELDRLQRNVSYHEGLLASLGTQFERARIQETFTSGRVRIVDRASWPTQKTLPNRILLSLGGAVLGLVLGVVCAILLHWRERLEADPDYRIRAEQLRHAFGGKSHA